MRLSFRHLMLFVFALFLFVPLRNSNANSAEECADALARLQTQFDSEVDRFYTASESSVESLLSLVSEIWKLSKLDHEWVTIPESKFYGVPAHPALRVVPQAKAGDPTIRYHIAAIAKLLDHSTLYDPVVLKQTGAVGLRQNRDDRTEEGEFRIVREQLMSHRTAKDLRISDTFTHEALHMHIAKLRRMGVDSDIHGYFISPWGSRLSQKNKIGLYSTFMPVEEIATIAHDTLLAAAKVREMILAGSKSPKEIISSVEFSNLVMRFEELETVAVQLEDLSLGVSPILAKGKKAVSTSPEEMDDQKWLRFSIPGRDLAYAVPLLGNNATATKTKIMRDLSTRLKRLAVLSGDVASTSQQGLEKLRSIKQAELISLETLAQDFLPVLQAALKNRAVTQSAMPHRPSR